MPNDLGLPLFFCFDSDPGAIGDFYVDEIGGIRAGDAVEAARTHIIESLEALADGVHDVWVWDGHAAVELIQVSVEVRVTYTATKIRPS